MNRLSTAQRATILSMLVEGSSLRSISRVTGASINTVTKLLVDAGNACADFHDEHVRGVRSERIQADEIWQFVYAKSKNVQAAKKAPPGAGVAWTWTATDADSKLVISWLLGPRDSQSAHEFMMDLAGRLDVTETSTPVQLTTDGLAIYEAAVRAAFGTKADYAQLVKLLGDVSARETAARYSPGECRGAFKRTIQGYPAPEHVSTVNGHRDPRSMTSWSYCRVAFGWRRGSDRATVAVRSPAPVTESGIGLNRPPDVGVLWALLRGQTALAALGRGDAGRLAAPPWSAALAAKVVVQPVGRVADAGRPARRLRELRKRAWRTSMRLSRRIQDGRIRPGAGGQVDRLHVACVAVGTLAQRAASQRFEAVPVVSVLSVGLLCRCRGRRVEQPPALGQLLLSGAVGEEPVIADPVKAGRQHVEQHAAYELGRRQRHGLVARRAVAAVVGVAKAHRAVVEAAQTLVADGDPVGVATEVVEDLLGAGEGPLGVDDPFGLAGRAQVVGEAAGVGEGLQPAGEVQLSGLEGVFQRREQDAAEVA